jgi:hypothetical protein
MNGEAKNDRDGNGNKKTPQIFSKGVFADFCSALYYCGGVYY